MWPPFRHQTNEEHQMKPHRAPEEPDAASLQDMMNQDKAKLEGTKTVRTYSHTAGYQKKKTR